MKQQNNELQVNLPELQQEASKRENYIESIKSFLQSDGQTVAPKRLEPNKA